jgi:hypothetical protein
MNKPLEWSTTLYINGTPHRITEMAESFYADLPDMPSRRCSYHHIGASALGALRSGQAVRTLGNTYSMMKPLVPEEEHPVAKPKRQSMKQRALIGVRNWCNKQLSKGESK